ncbi:ImmA/IrrE family metallo-endopeptidase [Priestia megaterium]|jgi:hypothetical protein|uniref:ImmA/IrrE family metallo-endopeptidase n=1 Tax=Priestia megaterium TaxID=1404 RepID=UPI002E1EF67F|nr:ImmA/IrrE family metallo-endopeptidase [Priestia megaterium]
MLSSYEKLQSKYSNILMNEIPLMHGFKGLYYDGRILIDKNLDETEKYCILAEELGHHFTTVGNILNQDSIVNRKQEKLARRWGYNEILFLSRLIEAFHNNCTNRYETASFLNVTEKFLQEALDWYKEKYGVCTFYDGYLIGFDPLMIEKLPLNSESN